MTSNCTRPERVPLTRMDNADPELMGELLETVADVAFRAAFTLGEEVEGFEQEWAAYCGATQAIGVSSGTEALTLCFRAFGFEPGTEVIVPANSFIATAEAVTMAGLVPRFADVDPDTALMTREHVEPLIDEKVRAIVVVHLYGQPVDIDPLLELGREHGLPVVEDAAQAHGASYRDRPVGSLGRCACFSFYPSKNLGAWGDAGAVTTNDSRLADHIRLLRSHGERPRYVHHIPGTTARLDGLQAAILRVKLRRLEKANAARRALARHLDAELEGTELAPLQRAEAGGDHVYHQYVVRSSRRDALREHLEARGVETGVHYPVPIHRTPAYARPDSAELPGVEGLATKVCSLPIFPAMSPQELERLITGCRSFLSAEAGRSHV